MDTLHTCIQAPTALFMVMTPQHQVRGLVCRTGACLFYDDHLLCCSVAVVRAVRALVEICTYAVAAILYYETLPLCAVVLL